MPRDVGERRSSGLTRVAEGRQKTGGEGPAGDPPPEERAPQGTHAAHRTPQRTHTEHTQTLTLGADALKLSSSKRLLRR